MLYDQRYRSGETRELLGLTCEQLAYMDSYRDGERDGTGWRKRSAMDLFRLMLSNQLAAHGIPVEQAVKIAHEIPVGRDDYIFCPGEDDPLREQLAAELFGRTLIARRDGTAWHPILHVSDGEDEPIEYYISRSAVVIRLGPLGEDLIARIREHALGERGQPGQEHNG